MLAGDVVDAARAGPRLDAAPLAAADPRVAPLAATDAFERRAARAGEFLAGPVGAVRQRRAGPDGASLLLLWSGARAHYSPEKVLCESRLLRPAAGWGGAVPGRLRAGNRVPARRPRPAPPPPPEPPRFTALPPPRGAARPTSAPAPRRDRSPARTVLLPARVDIGDLPPARPRRAAREAGAALPEPRVGTGFMPP